MSENLTSLRVRQVEERLRPWRERLEERPPPGGWIKTIRQALGMSTGQLATRLGITQQAVSDLEQREKDGRVTIGTLAKAAHAMGGALVYALVPTSSLDELLECQARAVAQKRVSRIAHSMGLEAQSTSPEEQERQVAEMAADLLARPRGLWDEDGP